jgi:hypothetical protein
MADAGKKSDINPVIKAIKSIIINLSKGKDTGTLSRKYTSGLSDKGAHIY